MRAMNQPPDSATTAATRPENTAPVIVNVAAYKFASLSQLPERRARLQALAAELDLKGTILISPEGINLVLAGARDAIDALSRSLEADAEIGPMEFKQSFTDYQPFKRMLVKIKREIIAFGVEGIDPARQTSPKLPAKQLKQWLDEGRSVTLLDVRNNYEVSLGTFAGAEPIGVKHFRHFPEAVDNMPEERKEETIVMFCTGGIRCEKAGPYMEQAGFKHVFQLEGGILKYFEQCGSQHYNGECFVFDQRVTVDANLHDTDAPQRLASSKLGWRTLGGMPVGQQRADQLRKENTGDA